MNEGELRKRAVCAHCQQKIGNAGVPLFYTVTIARHGINIEAVRAQAGLEMMFGSVALAQVMGPNEEMTRTIMEPLTITICERCSTQDVCVAQLAEYANNEHQKNEH